MARVLVPLLFFALASPAAPTAPPAKATAAKNAVAPNAGEGARNIAPAPDTAEQKEVGYRIDEPGTITFTMGVKIVGKVEKPEVVIFLPKERPTYRPLEFTYSFVGDIKTPLQFRPVGRPGKAGQ